MTSNSTPLEVTLPAWVEEKVIGSLTTTLAWVMLK